MLPLESIGTSQETMLRSGVSPSNWQGEMIRRPGADYKLLNSSAICQWVMGVPETSGRFEVRPDLLVIGGWGKVTKR